MVVLGILPGAGVLAAQRVDGASHYLDDRLPGLVARPYAPDVVSRLDRFQQNVTMTPDGHEVFFTETAGENWNYRSIIRLTRAVDGRITSDVPDFVREFKYERRPFIGEPSLSPDGNTLLFIADFPTDIWICRRTAAGEWGAPVKLGEGINSPQSEWYPTVASDGTLFFNSEKSGKGLWYQAEPTADGWDHARALDAPFNHDTGGDLALAPDGSCVVFQAMREGNAGEGDLYVSFRGKDGRWSAEISLGAAVNTAGFDFSPRFSPDGKYLFFSRRDKWQAASVSAILWVSAELLNPLRPWPRIVTDGAKPAADAAAR